MTDPVPDTKAPGTRWMWVGIIVVFAILAIGLFFMLVTEDGPDELPDYAVTTQEERLYQDVDKVAGGEDDLPAVNGAQNDTTITAEGGEVEVVTNPDTPE